MKTGAAISGLGHAALIAVMIFGLPWFPRRERPPIPVTEVSFVSEADFRRAQAAAQAPREEAAPAEQPRARPATPEAPPVPDPAPEPESRPEVAAPEPPPSEPPPSEPEVTTLAPSFNPDAPLSAPPGMPEISAAPPATELAAVAPPRARIAPAIAPAPSPPEASEPSEAPVPVPAPSPEGRAEPEPPAPSPDAAPEPASEAPEPPVALAPETSARPLSRRGNIETAAARPEPEAPRPETPQPETPRAESARPSDLVRQLREEVEREQARRGGATPPSEPTAPSPPSEGTAAATSLPSGPPITNSEKNGLVFAVQKCWNLPAGLRDAGELKVTLGAELNPDGSIVSGSVRLLEPNPAPDPRFQQAYEAGRRALLRCAPYSDLPREKYARWREIEVVFNPEGMVSW